MSGAFAHPGHAADVAEAAPLAVATNVEAATDWDNYEKLLLTKNTGEPIDLAVMPDSTVLHTARNGVVRLTDPTTGQTRQVAQLDVYANSEDGLQGVALDPDFEDNGWVYLVYAPRVMSGTSPSGVDYPETTPAGSAPERLPEGADAATYWNQWLGYNLLSRFQWDDETGTLDLSTEQEIIKVDAQRGQCCHVGADMAFDGEGNLYLSSGDNTPAGTPGANGYAPNNNAPGMNPGLDARRGAGSTNDLRGAILRIDVLDEIAPDAEPGPGSTYEIPAGNLFDSAEVDSDLVREEIYVMGLRNPFRIDYDVESGALVWGDYGPDAGAADAQRGPMGYVEWQLTTEPMNGGWPYCHGPNDGGAYNEWDFATGTPGEWFDCAGGPVNNSTWNTGLEQLPPVTEPQVYYGDNIGDQPWDEFIEFSTNRGQAPMGGPIFRHDAENDSAAQFPEYWDGKAFFAEFSMDYVAALSLDELTSDGVITQVENFLPNAHLSDVAQPIWDNVMDMEFGPDGSLYVLEYGDGFFRQNPDAGLYRVDYAEGNKTPQGYVTANPISSSDAPLEVEFDATASRDPEGQALTYEWDFEGTGEFVAGEATASYTYTELGQYDATLRVTDPAGKFGLATVQVTVGNTAPEVSVDVPNGAFFSWGDDIPVSVTVTDAEDDAAGGGEPAPRTLTAASTVGDWLEDPIGGPVLLQALGLPASALAQAAGFSLQDLVALSNGALTQAMVDAVLAAYADAPDGPTSGVDCNRVTWTFGLGHNEHAHPEVSGRGCDFVIETNESAQEHGEGEKLYGTLVVTYTDTPQGDVPAATGEATLILKPAHQQAEWFDSSEGVEVEADASAQALGKVTSLDAGDWFAFTPMSFHHAATGQAVDTVTARVNGEGTLALRWNDADAAPFAEVTVGAGEGWRDIEAAFGSVPAGSGTVYVTSTGGVEVDALTFSASGTTEPGDRILVPAEKVSLQMFSLIPWVSAESADGQDGLRTVFARLAEIGFQNVEPFGGNFSGRTAEEFRAMTDELGLRVPSSHFDTNEETFDETLAYVETLGQEYVGSGGFASPGIGSYEDTLATAAAMNRLGQRSVEAGFEKFFGHNHDDEFTTIYEHAGEHGTEMLSAWEILVEETNPEWVTFELDVAWAAHAGVDVPALIAEHGDRIELLHIKDATNVGGEGRPVFAKLGEGEVPLQDILAAAQEHAPIAYYVMEYDLSPVGEEFAEEGFEYLTGGIETPTEEPTEEPTTPGEPTEEPTVPGGPTEEPTTPGEPTAPGGPGGSGGGELPRTGADLGILAAAVLFLLGGAGALAMHRRRVTVRG